MLISKKQLEENYTDVCIMCIHGMTKKKCIQGAK